MNHYTLLDAGEERKLEQIGPYLVSRQATQAYWPKSKNEKEWRGVDAIHHRSKTGGGHWEFTRKLPESWPIEYGPFQFKIKLTGFGHIGLFPEQLENWRWIKEHSETDLRILNLFGYTGGSSLAGAAGGATVTHVDASKGVVSWARENAEANQLDNIRWIVEDVTRFIEREQRRGNTYHGVILDPPSFGRGPRGQVWKIETDLAPLLRSIRQIMPDPRMILLSCHTPGYSPVCLTNILNLIFDIPTAKIQSGEMVAPYKNNQLGLPSGTYARWASSH